MSLFEPTAAELLVEAYLRGEAAGGSVEWEDVDLAFEYAKEEIGEEAYKEMRKAILEDGEE